MILKFILLGSMCWNFHDVEAILNLSEQVDQGKVELIDDGFTGNTRVHITYEELKNES